MVAQLECRTRMARGQQRYPPGLPERHQLRHLYPTLFDLRKKWDPEGVFYAVATPGTEDREEIEYNTRLYMWDRPRRSM
ncbi:FAD binding domain-containing protein [Colletotrichum tabaci]|uniref:FAD binding domain-containing protein n=1 Tax=Colletotrichum tabaci TaxID=1209068 RepID=A0AAV9TDJ9_9PEZI